MNRPDQDDGHTVSAGGRKIPAGASDKFRREIEGLSEGSAYAFGFSDKKPSAIWWAIQIIMFAAAGTKLFGVW